MNDYVVPNLPGGREDEGTSKLLKNSMTTSRIQQLIYSKEMTDRLISKFQLYSHYDINPNSEFSYSLIKKILKKKITYKLQSGEIISISVQDKDPHFAAAVANEIGEKMSLMNKEMIVESLQKKVKLNEMILTEMSAMYNKTNLDLNDCLAQLKEISKTNRLENNLQWESTVNNFQSLTNIFSSKWENLTNSDKFLKLINISTTELFIPEIRIIQPATPSRPNSEIPLWLKISGYILASLSISILLVYASFSWKKYFPLNPIVH